MTGPGGLADAVDVDVVVVGGGPVGLAQSLELGMQGVRCLLVEKDLPGGVIKAKAGSVSYRSVEYCRRWGILGEVYDCGFPEDYRLDAVFCTGLLGHELDRQVAPSMAEFGVPDSTPVRRQRIPQMWFDAILERAAGAHASVDIRRGWTATSVTESGEGVTCRFREQVSGEEHEVRARYAVLCAGANSPLRDALDIGSTGQDLLNYSVSIIVRWPEFRDVVAHGDAARYILVGTEGTWGNFTVVDGREYWRLTVICGRERIDLNQFDPHAWMRKALGGGSGTYEILSVQPWRRSATVADTYGRGRVLLAGDIAHTMSNHGGFGMNTGLGDVVNLGWKLKASLAGWAGPGLVPSYTAERRAVAQRNIGFSNEIMAGWLIATGAGGSGSGGSGSGQAGGDAAGTPREDMQRIMDEGPEGERARRRVGRQMVAGTHDEWATLGAALGYRYEGSPICVPDGTPAPADTVDAYVPSARPGHRAPHFWLGPDHSVLDHFSTAFTVLDFGDAEAAGLLVHACKEAGVPVERVEVDDEEAASLYEARCVLMRPDGHVAWRGDAPGGAAGAAEVVDVARGAREAR